MKQEFANALSGIPVSTKTDNKVVNGYVIHDMMNFLYAINTRITLNKWRTIEHETDLFFVISENLNPLIPTKFILYKTKELAIQHIEEIS
jgi:hypothetical protein